MLGPLRRATLEETKRYAYTKLPPLPSTSKDYLHAEIGISLDGSNNVITWTSAGSVYAPTQGTAGNRPTYTNDGIFCRGKAAVQGTAAARFLSSAAGTTIFAANSKPYVCGVARMRAYAGGTNGITQFADAGVSVNAPGFYATATQLQNFFPASTLTVAFTRTDPIFYEIYLDASGVNTMAVDGVVVGTNGTGLNVGGSVINRMAIGASIGGASKTDSSHWWQHTCTALPTGVERAELWAYARGYWIGR